MVPIKLGSASQRTQTTVAALARAKLVHIIGGREEEEEERGNESGNGRAKIGKNTGKKNRKKRAIETIEEERRDSTQEERERGRLILRNWEEDRQ